MRHDDDGFRARIDRGQHLRHPLRVRLVLLSRVASRPPHPPDIGAGAEGGTIARQHGDADLSIGGDLEEGPRQFGDERVVRDEERVTGHAFLSDDGAVAVERRVQEMDFGAEVRRKRIKLGLQTSQLGVD